MLRPSRPTPAGRSIRIEKSRSISKIDRPNASPLQPIYGVKGNTFHEFANGIIYPRIREFRVELMGKRVSLFAAIAPSWEVLHYCL